MPPRISPLASIAPPQRPPACETLRADRSGVTEASIEASSRAADIDLQALEDALRPTGVKFVQVPDDFVMGAAVGTGAFGAIVRAKARSDDSDVAIKQLKATISKAVADDFTNELKCLAFLRHRHLLGLYAVCLRPLCIVTESCGGGTLYSAIHSTKKLPVVRLAAEIARSLTYLHDQGFVHRDLKPANLLFHSDGRVVLADFGLMMKVERATTVKEVVGSPAYMAPEMLFGEVSKRTDCFAFGVIMWEMATRTIPWTGYTPRDIVRIVGKEHRRLPPPTGVPAELLSLIDLCTRPNPAERPETEDILPMLKRAGGYK